MIQLRVNYESGDHRDCSEPADVNAFMKGEPFPGASVTPGDEQGAK